jgi:hypothetical protein
LNLLAVGHCLLRCCCPVLPVRSSPIKEVIFGIRAISPLVVALILLVACVLQQPLPDNGFVIDDPDWEESEEEESTDEEDKADNASEQQDEAAGYEKQWRGSSSGGGSEAELGRDSGSTSTAAAAAAVTLAKDVELGAVKVSDVGSDSGSVSTAAAAAAKDVELGAVKVSDVASDVVNQSRRRGVCECASRPSLTHDVVAVCCPMLPGWWV